jgi:hypothetical protein
MRTKLTDENTRSRYEPYETYETEWIEQFFHLPVALVVICSLVGGHIGPKKVVDDGNLTTFIIRYRLGNLFFMISLNSSKFDGLVSTKKCYDVQFMCGFHGDNAET